MTVRAAAVARPLERLAPPRRPALRPVASTGSSAEPAPRARRRLQPVTVAAGLVVAALLAVVGGNMLLASGQLRLEQTQTQLATAAANLAASQQLEDKLQSPSHVYSATEGKGFHEAWPQVIPVVTNLGVRLPAPRFSAAPCCTVTPRG